MAASATPLLSCQAWCRAVPCPRTLPRALTRWMDACAWLLPSQFGSGCRGLCRGRELSHCWLCCGEGIDSQPPAPRAVWLGLAGCSVVLQAASAHASHVACLKAVVALQARTASRCSSHHPPHFCSNHPPHFCGNVHNAAAEALQDGLFRRQRAAARPCTYPGGRQARRCSSCPRPLPLAVLALFLLLLLPFRV